MMRASSPLSCSSIEPLRARLGVLAVAGAALAVSQAGCSDRAVDPRLQPFRDFVASASSDIIGGQLDTTHQGVVAVLSTQSSCSGAIIAKDANFGYVLTAAHCVGPDLQVVVQGNNYQTGTQYNIDDYQAHSAYNQQVFDFAMVRFVGVGAGTPVIPPMTPALDNLAVNQQVLHVGYGLTGYNAQLPPDQQPPQYQNSRRRNVPGTLRGVDSLTIDYQDSGTGTCFGDSGGAQLTTSGQELVAGVTSYITSNDCSAGGVSGRVSAVYQNFILAYINGSPQGPLTCDQCFQATTGGVGTCADEVQACFANNDCSALNTCLGGCSTSACAQACVNAHPSGYAIFNAIYDCVCTTGCQAECANDSRCQGGINPTISSTTTTTTTTTTTQTGTGGSGPGGGGPGANGLGGSDWVAGDAPNHRYEGTLASGGCAVARASEQNPGSGSGGAVASLAAAALAALRLRRRRTSR